ncbi:acyltransferase family protein [Pseudomonas moraviensis]|uniref:Peptidoglycan/LPS O-acetylase OafA/YrhL n=1 Tax=Pseudomonas moraviensis TaxID=321662 RepID=A0A7Y9VZ01_9PSED|nr:peptidoglycan/LPS O-acetylase OafA/YrhL [Pseudomonas moraviensis]
MGVYRLLLAVLVALSHMGIKFAGLNPGVVAVISFLIISGFVMTSLIERNYKAVDKVGLFYLDRALRLYPQFLFYLFLCCAVVYFLLPGTPEAAELTLKQIVASLAIVPLDFYMFGLSGNLLMPPAWSLGLELCFYLVIPFLLIFKMRGVAFVLSVVVFMVACLGYINTDVYGYRLLPGVLFMFLCGSYLYNAHVKDRLIVMSTFVGAALLFVAIMAGWIERRPFNAEVTLGVALGIPAVFLLTKLRQHPLDEFFGNISYGVFLNHFVAMYLLRALWPLAYIGWYVEAVMVLSFAMSIVSYHAIERPALKLRHVLRAGVRSNVVQTSGRESVA